MTTEFKLNVPDYDDKPVTLEYFLERQLDGFSIPYDLRVLVSGGRWFGDVDWSRIDTLKRRRWRYVQATLNFVDLLHTSFIFEYPGRFDSRPMFRVINGGATGVDQASTDWFYSTVNSDPDNNYYRLEVYQAEWAKHGKAAGVIRNQEMIDLARPNLALVFPGGRGTADMLRRLRRTDIKTVELPNFT